MEPQTKFYAFLLVEHVEFEKKSNDLFRVQVVRHKTKSKYTKTLYRALTCFTITDADNLAYYSTEFCFPIKVRPKTNNTNKEQIFAVKLEQQNAEKKKIETIGRWYFDAANMENPTSIDLQKSILSTPNLGKATLHFRFTIAPFSAYPQGPPRSFFIFIVKANLPAVDICESLSETSTIVTETQLDEDGAAITLSQVDPIIPRKNSESRPEPSVHLAEFLKPVKNIAATIEEKAKKKKHKKSHEKEKTDNDSKGKTKPKLSEVFTNFFESKAKAKSPSEEYINLWNENELTTQFNELYDKNQYYLMILAVNQCYPNVLQAVLDYMFALNTITRDQSDSLIRPFIEFDIFQLPALTSDVLMELLMPIIKGIKLSIDKQHSLGELFSLFATTLNFGLKMSNTASLYTSAHLECLKYLAENVKTILQLLTQHLASTIASNISNDGFDFANENAMSKIHTTTSVFLEHAHGLNIPDQLIQSIVVHTCTYLDKLIYNVIVETAQQFTNEKVVTALNRIRELQKMFNCLPNNFQAAFVNLIKLFTTSKTLFIETDGDHTDEIEERNRTQILDALPKGPLLRSIVNRCDPPIRPPTGETIDYFGESLETYSSLTLQLDFDDYEFSFDWLYAQNATNKWDVI